MIKTLTTLAALASFTAPVFAASNINHHQQLWTAVESVGVSIRVNQSKDCDPKQNGIGKQVYGWYSGMMRTLVVCQEEAIKTGKYNRGQLTWSEEDLDTLRHEAHHLVQDCMDSSLNAELSNVYTEPVELALKVLGKEKSQRVVRMYANATDHTKVMELEAFSVAQMNDPLEQVNDIKRYCF